MDRVRVLLADDHALVREGLRLVLEREPDIEVVAEASDGVEALRLALREPIDLAVLDVSMPGMTGIQVSSELARRRPDVRVLLLSVHDDQQYLFEALRSGASGYVLKSAARHDLAAACRAATRGNPFLYPAGLATLAREALQRALDGEPIAEEVLSERELQVVKLIAEARSTNDIAALLAISPRTVERHRENILAKLHMRDRVEVTRYAIRRGLIEP
jgi:DNA-binding NarL/FixJ family response regulator